MFAIDKPKPVPPVCLFLEFSILLNGSKASSLFSLAMPGPLSSIKTSQWSSNNCVLTVALPAYFKALSRRFVKALLIDLTCIGKIGISLVGGDTVSSKKTSFTICAIGYSKKIIRRSECNLNDDNVDCDKCT